MSIFKNISLIKDKIKFLLEKYPHLRDSDNKLIANIWYNEIDLNITARELLNTLSKGELTNSESIRRCRQKIQELNPYLRGKNCKYKQKEAEQMKLNINQL